MKLFIGARVPARSKVKTCGCLSESMKAIAALSAPASGRLCPPCTAEKRSEQVSCPFWANDWLTPQLVYLAATAGETADAATSAASTANAGFMMILPGIAGRPAPMRAEAYARWFYEPLPGSAQFLRQELAHASVISSARAVVDRRFTRLT